MKVKLLHSHDIYKLEKKINEFISDNGIKVSEIQYSSSVFYVSVMIVYEEI